MNFQLFYRNSLLQDMSRGELPLVVQEFASAMYRSRTREQSLRYGVDANHVGRRNLLVAHLYTKAVIEIAARAHEMGHHFLFMLQFITSFILHLCVCFLTGQYCVNSSGHRVAQVR